MCVRAAWVCEVRCVGGVVRRGRVCWCVCVDVGISLIFFDVFFKVWILLFGI